MDKKTKWVTPKPRDILLVDDEEIVHISLSPYLRECGHRVDDATNGAEALQMIKNKRYDVIFLDVQMPGMDGLSMLERMGDFKRNTTVIFISALDSDEVKEKAVRLGAAQFLKKPVKLHELDEVIENLKI